MLSDRVRFSRWLVGVVLCAGLGLGGCGGGDTNELWDDLLIVGMQMSAYQQQASMQGNVQQMQMTHRETAKTIDQLLAEYPSASGGLRQVAEAMRDVERQLGEGEVSGAEADALRERQEEYWSYLRNRELPPDYR